MRRDRLSRFSRGRRGLSNIFKRSYKLRNYLGRKDRKAALKDLESHRSSGVTARPGGSAYKSELEGVYGKWRRDTKDRINRAEAKMIKKELEKYQRRLEGDPYHPRTSRKYFRRHQHPADKNNEGYSDPGSPSADYRPGTYGAPDRPSRDASLPDDRMDGSDFGGGDDGDFGSSPDTGEAPDLPSR